MKKSLTKGMLSKKRIAAIVLALSFVFGTATLTLVQATTIQKSMTLTIYDDGGMKVDLQIHNYNYNPNPDFTIFHAILKITNNYMEDIFVKSIYVESWSDPKGSGGNLLYGDGTKTDILVPAGETVVTRLNMKAYHVSQLVYDDSVYSYYSINWVHGANEYTKFGMHLENADLWWQLLYPNFKGF
ncbi:MAG: hypothetical protein LN416_07120 [Candidatus Thermoplasmatota archaeon]|nr:hypothetical protein [Candidatus Thermoplasmatota archaeon]